MNSSLLSWIGAFITTLAGVFALFSYTGSPPQSLTERASGATVAIIGGGIFAKIESEKESSVESQASKEVKAEPEPVKQAEPPKEIQKKSEKEAPKDPVKEIKAAEIPESAPEKTIEKHTPKKKEKKSAPPKKIIKKKGIIKPKPKPRKTRKKNRKASALRKKSGRRVASRNTGGASRGRQREVSGNAARSNFASRVNSHLNRHKQYPDRARERDLNGVTIVLFSISASGKLRSVRIVSSSGSSIIDRAAIATVRRASPFPRIPRGMSAPHEFRAPIRFKIR